MAYCRKCGKELKGEDCVCEKKVIKDIHKIKLDIKGILRKPIDYINKIDSNNHFTVSIIMIIAACISFGLMILGLVKNLVYIILGLIKTFVFMQANKAVADVEYGKEFMKFFEGQYDKELLSSQIAEINKSINNINVILYATIALAIALIIYTLIIYLVVTKKKNIKITFKECLTIVGYPTFFLIITNVLAYLSLFIWFPLFFVCFLVGIIIYVTLLNETIERKIGIESDFSPYLVSGGFIAALLVTGLLGLIILG